MTAIIELVAKILVPVFKYIFAGIDKAQENAKKYYERVKHHQEKAIAKVWSKEKESLKVLKDAWDEKKKENK